ncbi:MAG: hypothetical protein HY880_04675 [Deltaproteobacteria bacterium]|nr:hypothetical protein [Deltaproteobacteria bacterium]
MKRGFPIALFVFLFMGSSSSAMEIAVISHNEPGEAVNEKTVARIYLKKKTVWENDNVKIVPVNLSAGNDLREVFARNILKMNQRELVEYWNERYFKGESPPVVLDSEEAVKKFVREVKGAVGYIKKEGLETDLKVIYMIEIKDR